MLRDVVKLWFVAAVAAATLLAPLPASAVDDADRSPRPTFDYICWDAHRFSRTAADDDRDFRWLADLGFTHTLVGAPLGPRVEGKLDRLSAMLAAAAKHGVYVGFRMSFERDTARFAEALGLTPQQMIERGILLSRKQGKYPQYSPMHPDVIAHYADAFTRAVDQALAHDPGRRLRMFLIGTEMGWPLPKTVDQAYPKALEHIYAAAREDGVLAEGQTPPQPGDLSHWWTGAYTHGRDWRLRKAIEDRILQRIDNAQFWVDPVWAVKIVHGFGGDWSYIGDDPIHIADAVVRLVAVTRPAPAAHSTQLIRGATHDNILTANFLAVCVGAGKLYHWGVHTFEPGHLSNPFYRYDGPRTEAAKAERTRQILNTRRVKEPALRSTGRFLKHYGGMLATWQPASPRIALVAGVYGNKDLVPALIRANLPFDILRSREDREKLLPRYRFAMVCGTREHDFVYPLLQKVEQGGGMVFVPDGFEYPDGAPALKRPVTWDPTEDDPRALRQLLVGHGFRAYFDTDSRGVVARPYVHEKQPVLFVVNDRRDEAGTGLANEVTCVVRDKTAGLRVIDVDTGQDVALRPDPEGYRFSDTVGPAWYKLYAAIPPGKKWTGPGPLPAGPDVMKLTAARGADGVRLTWKLPFDDWAGCDVQRYRIHRAEADGVFRQIAEVAGRVMDGGGGIVTEYLDTAAPAKRCRYRVQTVTPLRRPGALSQPATVD